MIFSDLLEVVVISVFIIITLIIIVGVVVSIIDRQEHSVCKEQLNAMNIVCKASDTTEVCSTIQKAYINCLRKEEKL